MLIFKLGIVDSWLEFRISKRVTSWNSCLSLVAFPDDCSDTVEAADFWMSVHTFPLPNHDTNLVIAGFGYLFLGINLTTNLFFILSW